MKRTPLYKHETPFTAPHGATQANKIAFEHPISLAAGNSYLAVVNFTNTQDKEDGCTKHVTLDAAANIELHDICFDEPFLMRSGATYVVDVEVHKIHQTESDVVDAEFVPAKDYAELPMTNGEIGQYASIKKQDGVTLKELRRVTAALLSKNQEEKIETYEDFFYMARQIKSKAALPEATHAILTDWYQRGDAYAMYGGLVHP